MIESLVEGVLASFGTRYPGESHLSWMLEIATEKMGFAGDYSIYVYFI